MTKRIAWPATILASLVAVLGLAARGSDPVELEGTYRLVSRDLPDGTTVTPPDIRGLITFDDGYRNFNIYWTDDEGNPVSIGIIAVYEFADDTYTETNVYTMTNEPGTGVSYDLEPTSGSVQVTRGEGSISMSLPLRDEPDVVITGDGFTATREGEFVDHWERVE